MFIRFIDETIIWQQKPDGSWWVYTGGLPKLSTYGPFGKFKLKELDKNNPDTAYKVLTEKEAFLEML